METIKIISTLIVIGLLVPKVGAVTYAGPGEIPVYHERDKGSADFPIIEGLPIVKMTFSTKEAGEKKATLEKCQNAVFDVVSEVTPSRVFKAYCHFKPDIVLREYFYFGVIQLKP